MVAVNLEKASDKKESPAKEEPEVKDKVEEKPAEIEKVATPVKAEATPEKKESPAKSDAAPFDPKSPEQVPAQVSATKEAVPEKVTAQASATKEAVPENRLTFAPKVEESSPEKVEAPKKATFYENIHMLKAHLAHRHAVEKFVAELISLKEKADNFITDPDAKPEPAAT